MKDPHRLLTEGTSDEMRVLASGLDEPLPAGMLEKALAAAGATGVASAPHASSPPATQGAGAKIGVGAAKLLPFVVGGAVVAVVGVVAALARLSAPPTSHAAMPASSIASVATTTEAPAVTASAEPVAAPSPSSAGVGGSAPSSARTTAARPGSSSPSASASASASTLMAEIALLDEARRALRGGDRSRARDALRRYRAAHPHGQMAREAELLRAEAFSASPASNP